MEILLWGGTYEIVHICDCFCQRVSSGSHLSSRRICHIPTEKILPHLLMNYLNKSESNYIILCRCMVAIARLKLHQRHVHGATGIARLKLHQRHMHGVTGMKLCASMCVCVCVCVCVCMCVCKDRDSERTPGGSVMLVFVKAFPFQLWSVVRVLELIKFELS